MVSDENSLAFFRAYERTIPWYVPLGYAWFFGGSAYLVWRVIEGGASATRIWQLFAATVLVDWLAVSICGWLDLSAFYGNQPFHVFGSPLWFSFCDATGGFVLGAAMAGFVSLLRGARRLWLLPSLTYASTRVRRRRRCLWRSIPAGLRRWSGQAARQRWQCAWSPCM